jgi:hypothetical protein
MKATELRIGNYYQYAGDYGITYARVKEIKHNQFGLLGDFNGTNFGICKPIPLTEEWLLKFGFEKKYDNFDWYIKDNYCVAFSKHIDLIRFKIKYQENDICKIQHVHQLQNLHFALTGEELTIKNTPND